jgi:hypothetical protein
MIRPLRQRHRRVFYVLALILPLAFATGIAARKRIPVMASKTFSPSEMPATRALWTDPNLFSESRIITSLREQADGRLTVQLLFRDLVRADMLLYWQPGEAEPRQGLGNRATLLGAIGSASKFPLQPSAKNELGRLILYSLADHEVVVWSKTFRAAKK